jgi:hypothetical protein
VTAAVGRFSQWTHSLAREDIPVRLFDFWVASDSLTPVSSAWHYVLGSERWLTPTRYVRIEGFYKRYGNLLEGNPQEDPARHGDEFNVVNGDSYGADVLIRQFENGPFSGWISYTYAVAARNASGTRYFPGHDRRHDLNVVASWRLSKYLFGVRYGYATGTPYTDIVGQVVRRIYDPGPQRVRDARQWKPDAVHRRNSQRRPLADDAAARPRCHAPVSAARNDHRALFECRERLQCEERLHLHLRLHEEPADAPADFTVSSSPVRRCHDSLLTHGAPA